MNGVLFLVHVSFQNYRSLHPYNLENEEDEDQEEEEEEMGEESCQDYYRAPRGHQRSKGVAPGNPTKHDAVLCGRKNVRNMEKFPPDFPAGDLNEKGQDYRLSNSVFNTLKQHSQKEEKHVSVVMFQCMSAVLNVVALAFSLTGTLSF